MICFQRHYSTAQDVVPNSVGFVSKNVLLIGVMVMEDAIHPRLKDHQHSKTQLGNYLFTHYIPLWQSQDSFYAPDINVITQITKITRNP